MSVRQGQNTRHRTESDHVHKSATLTHRVHKKGHEPISCPDCDLVYYQGHWTGMATPADADHHRCPACQRIHDGNAAGVLSLEGHLVLQLKDELMYLVRILENREKADHPLDRIMSIEETDKGLRVNYTGEYLPRVTGQAIRHAYHDKIEIQRHEAGDSTKITWFRN